MKTTDVNYSWYSSKTGVYSSKHLNIQLSENPFLDVVTHIFSYPNDGSRLAFVDNSTGQSIPYSQLFSAMKSMAFGLQEAGFSQGDVAVMLLPNSVYFPVMFLSILYIGGIVTPMNPLSSFSEIKRQIASCRASFAFAQGENVAKLKSLGLTVIQVPENVEFSEQTNKSCEFHKLMFSYVGKLIKKPKINQDDIATIIYSSGTTGPSKGVMLTHRNLISSVELFVRFESSRYKELSSENVYLAVLPMYHILGLVLFCFGLVSLGITVVVMKKFDINEVIKAIQRYKITHFPMVPPILSALNTKAKSLGDAKGLRSLKQVICGAAAITPTVLEDFLHNFPGADFIQGYGMTESTAVGAYSYRNNDRTTTKLTSVGLLAPNTEAKVVNVNTGLCMPPGQAGELLLHGPGIMKGYLDNKEATRLTIEENGWLHTGDIVYFDHDGYLYVVERLKDIIKYKGFQIAPNDLEAILMSHPDILDVAVSGAADEEAGEIPVAFVVKKPGSFLSKDEVIEYVAKEVAPYKKVREVKFVSSIPKSTAGKVLRRELRNLITSKL